MKTCRYCDAPITFNIVTAAWLDDHCWATCPDGGWHRPPFSTKPPLDVARDLADELAER